MATVTEARTAKNRYLPDIRHRGWKLGQGGCSTTVERFATLTEVLQLVVYGF